jgi:LPS-assembly protein
VSQNYEFLAFSVMQKYYFDPTFGGAFIPDELNQFYPLNTLTGFSATGIERNLSPLSMSLRVTPKPGISYDMRFDYDPKLGRLRNASIWTAWRHDKYLFAGTYVKTNSLEPSTFAAHNIQGQFAYRSPEQRGISGSMTLSYDFQTQKLLASTARMNYMWNCCGVAVEYQQYSLDLRRENRVTFSFSLKGIGHFGNLRRPDSLF